VPEGLSIFFVLMNFSTRKFVTSMLYEIDVPYDHGRAVWIIVT
jgi:hypothetical protein